MAGTNPDKEIHKFHNPITRPPLIGGILGCPDRIDAYRRPDQIIRLRTSGLIVYDSIDPAILEQMIVADQENLSQRG